jgi:hypothetical protein
MILACRVEQLNTGWLEEGFLKQPNTKDVEFDSNSINP